jgi:CHAT domain-containing protein/tetratricopeptide (TPR) repeat protein
MAVLITPGCHRGSESSLVEDTPKLRPLHDRASAAVRRGDFTEAEALYRQAYDQAAREGRRALASRYLGNAGSCRFAVWDLRGALSTFLQAHDMAVASGDMEEAGRLSANLASLYIQLGNFDWARQTTERGLRELRPDDATGTRSSLLTLSGQINSRLGDQEKTEQAFRAAIGEADRLKNRRLLAQAWDNFGFVELQAGHLPNAARALLESYRLSVLFPKTAGPPNYPHLSELAEREGDLRTASVLLRRAFENPAIAGAPDWYLHFQAGRIQAHLQHRAAALAEYRKAIDRARAWHEGTAPTDALRAGSSHWLDALYAQYIETLIDAPDFERPGSVSAREAFLASEERRSAALRQTLLERERQNVSLPQSYWTLLAQLRTGQSRLLTDNSGALRASLRRIEQRLQEIEVKALAPPAGTTPYRPDEKISMGETLSSIEAKLSPREVLLSFHLGSRSSCVWAVRRRSFEAHRLKAASLIRDDAEKFLAAIEQNRPSAESAGKKLYASLFQPLGAGVQRQPEWVLTSEETLLRTPLAALPVGAGGHGFLIERHTLRFVPSALSLRASLPLRREGPFLGIGDGVYNRADPRWRAVRSVGGPALDLTSVFSAQASIELPRLVGSGQELMACARVFGMPEGVLLTGHRATRTRVEEALRREPAVIHIAAHVLQPGGRPEGALIALGLNPTGSPEVLTHYDIVRWNLHGATVVMSGCSSASAPAPDPIGMLGLARAWLIAGADAVVGTRWADPDDSGSFFVKFYENLRRVSGSGTRATAEALQAAQLEMIRSGSWRAKPSYWSSFYEMGKE